MALNLRLILRWAGTNPWSNIYTGKLQNLISLTASGLSYNGKMKSTVLIPLYVRQRRDLDDNCCPTQTVGSRAWLCMVGSPVWPVKCYDNTMTSDTASSSSSLGNERQEVFFQVIFLPRRRHPIVKLVDWRLMTQLATPRFALWYTEKLGA